HSSLEPSKYPFTDLNFLTLKPIVYFVVNNEHYSHYSRGREACSSPTFRQRLRLAS
ncbi:hypothetical protein L9F63_019471, partial [Diploptera punctata]